MFVRSLLVSVVCFPISALAEGEVAPYPDGEASELKRPQPEQPADLRSSATEGPSQVQPRVEPPPRGKLTRTVGAGVSGGGGLVGASLLAVGPYGGNRDALGVVPQFPTLDLRFFLEGERSIDFSFHLTRTIATLARARGLIFGADLFYNFNPRTGSRLRMLLGPGLSVSGGASSDPGYINVSSPIVANPYGYNSYMPWVGFGSVSLAAEIGAELLTEGLGVGVTFALRPSLGFLFSGDAYGPAVQFVGGAVGVIGLNLYGTREQ